MNKLSPFLALFVIVPAIHFFLLKPVWENGLGPDDWGLLYVYKSLVGNNNPLFQIGEVWHVRGPHTTYQVYYIGLLEKAFGLNYGMFQTINILFKTIATLSVYFLVKTIFKRKSLAFLTAILFAVSYTSTGTLKFIVQGADYLALASMNVFLIAYYHSIKHFRYTVFLPPLLYISVFLSPIRIYPLLLLLPITEIFLIFLSKKKIISAGIGFCRVFLMFTPLLALALFDRGTVIDYFWIIENLFQRLNEGKWYILLNPLSGLGIFFMPFKVFLFLFGNETANFLQYFIYTLPKYLLFLFPIAVAASILISQRPKTFFKRLFFANLITLGIFFFLINHNPSGYGIFDLTVQLFGAFILEIALLAYLEWKSNSQKADSLLLPIWFGVGFSFLFLFSTWVFAFEQVYRGIQNYLMVPSMGLSLFFAAILFLIYQRIRIKRKVGAYLAICSLILIFFYVSKQEISHYFINELTGWKASDQMIVQHNILKQIKNFLKEPALFFFDLDGSSYRFYEVSALSTFPNWTNYYLGTNENSSCRAAIYGSREILVGLTDKRDNMIRLKAHAYCISNGKEYFQDMKFDLNYFYAYKFKNKQLINEKNEIVDYLLNANK